MSSLRTFHMKEAYEGDIRFSFLDRDNDVIDLDGGDTIHLAIKRTTVDAAAVVTVRMSDPEMSIESDHVLINFNASQLTALTPGTYVADFYLEHIGVAIASDTFMFIVDTLIAPQV